MDIQKLGKESENKILLRQCIMLHVEQNIRFPVIVLGLDLTQNLSWMPRLRQNAFTSYC